MRMWAVIVGYCCSVMAAANAPKLILYTEDWPPLNYMQEDHQIAGSATDNVRRIMAAAGIEYDIQLVPWNRGYTLAAADANSGIFSIFRTPERDALFHWFCPLAAPQQISLFKLASRDDLTINKLDDAKAYILGVLRGDYANQFLQHQGFVEGENLLVSSDEHANIRQLLSERVDFTVQTPDALYFRLHQLGESNDKVSLALPSIDGHNDAPCLAINLNTSEVLLQQLRQAFQQTNPSSP